LIPILPVTEDRRRVGKDVANANGGERPIDVITEPIDTIGTTGGTKGKRGVRNTGELTCGPTGKSILLTWKETDSNNTGETEKSNIL
jgi:hypothetical protein